MTGIRKGGKEWKSLTTKKDTTNVDTIQYTHQQKNGALLFFINAVVVVKLICTREHTQNIRPSFDGQSAVGSVAPRFHSSCRGYHFVTGILYCTDPLMRNSYCG